jgi:hypothetical protein
LERADSTATTGGLNERSFLNRLEFLAPPFVSRQKVGKRKKQPFVKGIKEEALKKISVCKIYLLDIGTPVSLQLQSNNRGDTGWASKHARKRKRN